MPHECHAHGCKVPVPPRMLMCERHWRDLPKPLRDAIWRKYRPGQELTKKPSSSYMAVQRLAISHTAFRPNSEQAALEAAALLREALAWQQRAIREGAADPLEGLL